MASIRTDERARRLDHLVRREGVASADALAFLDLLEALHEADPPFHASMEGELEGRMLRADSEEAARARAALDRIASARETRVGPDRQLYFEKGGKAVTRDSGRFNWWGRDPSWKDVLGYRGARDVEKPAGEWNHMDVVCDGDSITTILNGYLVNIGTKSSLTRGKILFQSEGAEILFRKIEVRPLMK